MAAEPREQNFEEPEELLALFEREAFSQRLARMIQRTNAYGGTLLDASKSLEIPEARLLPPAVEAIEVSSAVQYAIDGIRNSEVESVVIEAAHVYDYDSLDDPEFVRSLELQLDHAVAVRAQLEAAGLTVHQMLFIDNYNPHPETGELQRNLDRDAYFALAESRGFGPFSVVYEADMAPLAEELTRHLADSGLTKSAVQDGEEQILLSDRKIELKRGDKMSCASLDAALCLVKYFSVAEGAVNILPRKTAEHGADMGSFSYTSQQEKTRRILKNHLRSHVLPFFNVFVDPEKQTGGRHHSLWKSR